jgi:hypothetical protein
MAGGGVQVLECLPSKYEALNSNPSITRKKKVFLMYNMKAIINIIVVDFC